MALKTKSRGLVSPALFTSASHLRVVIKAWTLLRPVEARLPRPRVEAARWTLRQGTCTVRGREGGHGHSQGHRRHHERHRQEHEYALHCFSPPPSPFGSNGHTTGGGGGSRK